MKNVPTASVVTNVLLDHVSLMGDGPVIDLGLTAHDIAAIGVTVSSDFQNPTGTELFIFMREHAQDFPVGNDGTTFVYRKFPLRNEFDRNALGPGVYPFIRATLSGPPGVPFGAGNITVTLYRS